MAIHIYIHFSLCTTLTIRRIAHIFGYWEDFFPHCFPSGPLLSPARVRQQSIFYSFQCEETIHPGKDLDIFNPWTAGHRELLKGYRCDLKKTCGYCGAMEGYHSSFLDSLLLKISCVLWTCLGLISNNFHFII